MNSSPRLRGEARRGAQAYGAEVFSTPLVFKGC